MRPRLHVLQLLSHRLCTRCRFILLDVPKRLLGLNAEGTFSLRPRKAASKQIELAYVYKKAAKVWTIPSPAGKVFQRRINCRLTRSWEQARPAIGTGSYWAEAIGKMKSARNYAPRS